MDAEDLSQLDRPALTDYLWRRFRLESPVDPPLDPRGDEEPEQFVIEVFGPDGAGSRRTLADAMDKTFVKLAGLQAVAPDPAEFDATTDNQIASLAFLIAELRLKEAIQRLYVFACSWFAGDSPQTMHALSFGQQHLLRTLAQLSVPGMYTDFWRDLWENGPRSLRGLTIFGLARANEAEALKELDELAASAGDIDLPATVWSLQAPEGPGLISLAKAAAHSKEETRDSLRKALVDAGAYEHILRDFDGYCSQELPPQSDSSGQSHSCPALEALVPDRPGYPQHAPSWVLPTAA